MKGQERTEQEWTCPGCGHSGREAHTCSTVRAEDTIATLRAERDELRKAIIEWYVAGDGTGNEAGDRDFASECALIAIARAALTNREQADA